MHSGAVAVVHYGHILGELVYEPHLLHRKGGSAGCHYIFDAQLMHHHHIEIALDEYAAVLTRNLSLGVVYAQKVAALDVDVGLGRIDILGRVVGAKGSAAEGHHPSAHRVDGEHNPLAELVFQASVLRLHCKARIQDIFFLVTGGPCGIQQGGRA